MGARHGKVRLRASHAHDARALTTNGGLGSVVAAGDVAGIGERQHLLRRSRRLSALPHATCRAGFRESRRLRRIALYKDFRKFEEKSKWRAV